MIRYSHRSPAYESEVLGRRTQTKLQALLQPLAGLLIKDVQHFQFVLTIAQISAKISRRTPVLPAA